MITVNRFDFDNADIGKLAIVPAEAWRPVPAAALPVDTSSTAGVVYSGYGVLLGVSWQDTHGTDANTLTVYDGTSDDGPVIARHTVAASSAVLLPFPVPGVQLQRGLAVKSTAAGSAVLYLARHVRHD
jgi:hypothetical protein